MPIPAPKPPPPEDFEQPSWWPLLTPQLQDAIRSHLAAVSGAGT